MRRDQAQRKLLKVNLVGVGLRRVRPRSTDEIRASVRS
jgi:hypothetical protein